MGCCLLLPLSFLAVWLGNTREFADGFSEDGPGLALRVLNIWISGASFKYYLPSAWPSGSSSFSAEFAAALPQNTWATCLGCFSSPHSLSLHSTPWDCWLAQTHTLRPQTFGASGSSI